MKMKLWEYIATMVVCFVGIIVVMNAMPIVIACAGEIWALIICGTVSIGLVLIAYTLTIQGILSGNKNSKVSK